MSAYRVLPSHYTASAPPCRSRGLQLTARCTIDTTTSSSSSLSVTLVSESPACSSVSPTTHTLRATSRPSVSTSCVGLYIRSLRPQRANTCQKIRTIELDGKTVKLQIVRTPSSHGAGWVTNSKNSGTPQAKSAFEPSHPRTTAAPTVSASSTMSPTWTHSTT
jgi:hypothetical protein